MVWLTDIFYKNVHTYRYTKTYQDKCRIYLDEYPEQSGNRFCYFIAWHLKNRENIINNKISYDWSS